MPRNPAIAPFKKIVIIGTGLIGGSLGMAIKQRFPGAIITGVDRATVLQRARLRRAIDQKSANVAAAVRDADLVLLATPVASILKLIPIIAELCSSSTVVTDVGSVKRSISATADQHFSAGNFVGGHPMAGLESSGIDSAHPLLFQNAFYVLTPTPRSKRAHVLRLAHFLAQIGARPVILSPSTHDRVAAAVSHLPQLLAVALTNVVGKQDRTARRHLTLAAGGFRDLTRIASSRFDMWQDVLKFNKAEIRAALQRLRKEVERYERSLAGERDYSIGKAFTSARAIRKRIPKTMKGFLHSLPELHVFVADQPGSLSKLTAALARAGINIKDIELMKVREGTGGTFRIAFESRIMAEKAARILQRSGFRVASGE